MSNKSAIAQLLKQIALEEYSRNPTLSEHAFRILPYRGVGSGIPRALEEWPQIELKSEVSGNQFTALIRRPAPQWQTSRDLTATTIMSPIEAERLESRLESQLESRLAARLVLLIAQAEAGKQLVQKIREE